MLEKRVAESRSRDQVHSIDGMEATTRNVLAPCADDPDRLSGYMAVFQFRS